MNVSTRTSTPTVPYNTGTLKNNIRIFTQPKSILRWLGCMMVVMMMWAGNASAQITVTNPGNTTPALAGTYLTLQDAIVALNAATAISGPVTIAVDAATPQTAPSGGYAITAQLTGASATNLVTFEGNGNTVTASNGQVAGTLTDAIFKFVGADFMTIQNFVMQEEALNTTTAAATNNMTEWAVAVMYASVTNGAQNISIINNTISLNRTYQNTFGIYSNATHGTVAITTSAPATSPAGANSNLVVYGNNISNVNMGIVVVGSTTAANMNAGVDIGGTSALTGNTITNYGTTGTFSGYVNVSGTVNGILVRNATTINVSYNTVTSSVGGVISGTLNGIQIPAFSATPTGTYTNNYNNNNISLRSGVAAGGMQGIAVGSASATLTSTVNINNNNFGSAFGHTVVATGAITFISNANGATALTTNINSNTFTNMTVNTTGTVAFIGRSGNMPSGSSENVNNNSIVTSFTKTGSGGSVIGYSANASSVNGSTMTNTGNNFSNVNIVGITGFTGWSNTDGSGTTNAPTKTITGNTFSNISATGIIVPGGTIFGMSVNFSGPNTNVSNNTISNLSGGGTVVGLSYGTSNGQGTHTVSNNTITNLTSTGQGTAGVGAINGIQAGSSSIVTFNLHNNTVTGLITQGASQVNGIISTAGAINNIFKNTVCNVESNNASGSVNGIVVSAGTTQNIYNNRVADLRTPLANAAWPLTGINAAGGTNVNVYYNSVYLNATSAGAIFGSAAFTASTTPTVDLRNNILYNTSTANTTGLTVAYRRTGTTLTTYAATSNRNDFFAATIYTDGTTPQATMGAYQALVTPRDIASVNEAPNFLSTACGNANFLKIDGSIASLLESGAVNIAGITDDFENNTRAGNGGYGGTGTAPDIGADEFAGSSPAPIITLNSVTPPDASLCTATARLISVTATTPSGTITGVTITYNNGTLNSNVLMTNVGGNVWEYTIPAASPTNTSVTWSATATNSLALTATVVGAGYQDDPLFGYTASATANPGTVCAGSPSVLTAALSFTSTPQTYCAISFNNLDEDDIGQVTFAGINNPASRPSPQTSNLAANSSYTNFTATPAAMVAPGSVYPITVYHFHDGTDQSANFANVYIDFNQNGTLTDAGEVFSLTKVGGLFLTDFTGNITVPANAKPGITLMRVVLREGAITTPCGAIASWGEAEDYNVNVLPAITSILWSNGGTTNPLTVNPTSNTTYSATITAAGCTIATTTNATVTATALPAQPLATNGSQCGVGVPTTTFVATGGQSGTFRWYDAQTGGNLLQTGGATYGSSISATTVFWVSEDNGPTTCESVRTQVTAIVNAPDTVQASVNNASVCLGSSITLTATKTSNVNGNVYVYTWTAAPQPGSGLPIAGTVGSPITITPTAAGSYAYIVTAFDAVLLCTTNDTVNVTINALPVIDSLTATPAALCNGGSTTLNVYSGVVTTGPNGLPATYCVPTQSGSADITTVIFNTLSNTSIVQVAPFYNIYPASGSTTTTVSRGETYPITLATTGATIISVWIDYDRDGVFEGVASGEWTQPWTNNNTSTVNITIPVTATLGQTGMRVRTRLAGNPNADTDACSNFGSGTTQDYTITINNVVKQNPAYTYAWMDLLNAVSIGTNSPTVAGVTPNTPPSMDYSVSITDGNGCVSIDTLTVIVNAVPPAPTGTDGSQCGAGIPTTTTVASGSGAPTPIFKWYDAPTGGTLLQTGTSNSYTTSISVTTTFYVSEISAAGCEGPRSTVVTATVNQPDEITISSSTGVLACFGEQFAVSSTYTPNVNNFNNYVLTALPVAGSGIAGPVTLTFTGTGSDPYNITPSAAGIYQYIITADESGNCITADTITITVNALPVLDSVTATPLVICAGANSQLNGYSLSYANGPQTAPTGYGASSPSSPDDEDMGNVTFGSINNTSTCATTGGGLSVLNQYSDYTGLTPATVAGGQSVPFSISSITCGGNWANRIAMYIDYNRDGDFDDAGENVYLEPTSTTGPHTVSGNILIPLNASAGITLMRVIVAEATGLNPLPIITPVNGANEYAWGETEDYLVNIQAAVLQNPALTYTWNTVPATTPFTGNPATVSPSTTTTYSLVATDAAGCSSAASQVTVTVNLVPTTPGGPNLSSSQCGLKVPTASVQSTSGFGTPTFNWYNQASGGTLLQSSTSTTYTTAISVTTSFWVSEVVLATGCESGRVQVDVTVTNPPTLAITAGGATTFCSGGSVSLDASASPTDPGYNIFSWSPALGLSATNVPVVTASPTTTTTYTVVANDGVSGPLGCSNTATITITVNPNPVIDSVNATPATVCATGSATLNVYSPSVGAGPITAPAYALPGTTGNASGDNITLSAFGSMSNPSAGGGGVNGYEDFTSVTAPTVNLNTAYNLTVHVADGGTETAAAWIDWNRNGVYDASEFYTVPLTFNGGTFEWEGTVSVTVPATAKAGLTGLRVRSRFSTALTAADALLAYSFGETEEYRVNVIGVLSQNPALTYTWNTVPVTTTLSGASVSTGALSTPTTYNVTVTDGLGCFTVSSNVFVNVLPVTAAPTAASPSICAGGSTTLAANAGGGGPFTYAWTDGTNPVGTTASISVSPAITTTYFVTVTDACLVSTAATPVTVTVNPVPTSSIQEAGPITICDPLIQVLTAVTDGIAPTYQWKLNGVDIPLATNPTYTVSGVSTGSYTVVVTSGLGCASLPSAAVAVTINPSPSGVTVSASQATICAGETVNLFSSASAPSPSVLSQNFESGIGSWTTTNLTTGANPATSAWTIQTNPYTAPNAGPFNSAGGTSFILSNPDDGGSGTAVNSLLTSPAFSTMGYSSLSMSLSHYYRLLSTTEANVEVSTNGTTWTTVKTYTTTQGTPTAFVTDNISLNAYIGNPSVQVRFRYQNGWSWYWAIDDIAVTGTPAAFNYSWTSTPAGFTSAVQNPTGAAPLVNTTYDVSISYAATGCATSGNTAVTVTECPSVLSLTAFLEGFYAAPDSMRPTINLLAISADPTETDTLTVNLWSPTNLSSPTPDYTALAVVHTNGTVDPISFPAGLGGDPYYIAVKHRNHLETWSKLPVTFKPAVSYDFTTSQAQAYDDGINPAMASVAGGKFAFYGGDVNQDGGIDATDQSLIDNDVPLFLFDYIPTDVTGDGTADASDMQIVDNNIPLFLFYARPF